ncbi:MAG: DUF2071 domain-containing protein [Archangiaceae bacterium]|nr:DUF2071 domain-containing protein [Archangiaceae bacterium]
MVLIHVAAMLSMALVLARFLPGGGIADDAERVRLLAEHPWLFRLGWLPWQLTALVDFIFALVLVRAPYLPRALTVPALLLTCVAIVPDQYAQAVWVTHGIALASGDLATYLAWERPTFLLTAGWGACGYTLGTLVMLAAFYRAKVWSVALQRATLVFCVAMVPAAVSPLVPLGIPPPVVAVLNALGFSVLLVLYATLLEVVLGRRIADEAHGRWAPWRLPFGGVLAGALERVARSRFFYALLEPVPVVAMVSDITDVIYVSYLLDAARLEPLVPPGLTLQRLGPQQNKAVFTFLSYRHGSFGFRFLGPLRRLSPSAIQTNWRIHVTDPVRRRDGIFFLTNAIDNLPQALGARLFSEGMPMHVLHEARLTREGDALALALEPGRGTAPDARVQVRRSPRRELPPDWAEVFGSFDAMLEYVVPQNRALSSQPYRSRITRQEIDLPIATADCTLLEGTVESQAARAIAADAAPLCFHVPKVGFLFSEEVHEPSG